MELKWTRAIVAFVQLLNVLGEGAGFLLRVSLDLHLDFASEGISNGHFRSRCVCC